MEPMTIARPTHDGGWTIADLESLPEDGLRYELLDGMLLVSPPAVFGHYPSAFELGVLLRPLLGPEWRIAPGGPGVDLSPGNYREPDLVVARREAMSKKFADSADVLLVVEFMSPSSVTDDRVAKPAQYARAGIAHYWRVEQVPRTAPVMVTYVLDGSDYRETGRFTDEVRIDDPVRLRFRLPDLLS